jgi:WD40 repeat protein
MRDKDRPVEQEPGTGEAQVYAVRKDLTGWRFSRRDFLAATSATAVALAGATLGCGTTPEPTATPIPTATPTPTATPPPTLSPQERAQACVGVKAHQDSINRLLISRDGTTMVSASADGIAKLWSLPEGALIKALAGEQALWIELLETGAGQTLLATNDNNAAIKLWSLPGAELVETLEGWRPVLAFVRPGGTILALADEPNTAIKLWWLEEKKALTTLEGHVGSVWALKANPAGTLLASAGQDGIVRLWSPITGTLIKALEGHTEGVWDLAVSPDGAFLISGGIDNTVRLWSLPEGELVKTLEASPPMLISPDGALLITRGPEDASKTIELWSLPEGELVKTLEGTPPLAISPDGALLASADENDSMTIKLWSLPKGDLITILEGHTTPVQSLVVRPDGALMASGDREGCVRLWSLPQGEFASCLVDLAANDSDVEGVTYNVQTASGQTVEYTQPCGAPIPPGATCVCNCVAGGYGSQCTCVGDTAPSGGHYWYPC